MTCSKRLMSMLAVLTMCVGAFAQSLSIQQLVDFLRSSIKLKQPDKDVAAQVSRLHLTQKLDDATIEQLQTDGLGPKTVAALRALSATTASLPTPELKKPEPPPVPLAPPSADEQRRVLDEAREYALNYSKSLPNFICAQVTRRSADPNGSGNYRVYDTVTAKLTYFEQREKYQTLSVNDKYTDKSFDSLGGSISTGEFGSMLRGIFDPETAADFHWTRWATLRGRRAHVYSYAVEQSRSRWQIEDRNTKEHIVPAYTGLVYVDAKEDTVLAFTLKAVDIPATFSIQGAESRLDYAAVEINGTPFVLPFKAEMHLRSGREDQKNEISFLAYHKYSADTELKFGDIVIDPEPKK